MNYSYDESASDGVSSRLLEWAIDHTGGRARSRRRHTTVGGSLHRRRNARLSELLDVTSRIVESLEREELSVDVDVDDSRGVVKIMYEDANGMPRDDIGMSRRVCECADVIVEGTHACVIDSTDPIEGIGGNITVGLMSGVGFSDSDVGLDPDYDVYADRDIHVVKDKTATITREALDKLSRLVTLWEVDRGSYDDVVSHMLESMDHVERDQLDRWIASRRNSVGIPGTTLEEVLVDVRRRITMY